MPSGAVLPVECNFYAVNGTQSTLELVVVCSPTDSLPALILISTERFTEVLEAFLPNQIHSEP